MTFFDVTRARKIANNTISYNYTLIFLCNFEEMINSKKLVINNWHVRELEKKIITSEFPLTSIEIDATNPTCC